MKRLHSTARASTRSAWRAIVADAVWVALVFSALALGVNAVRTDGLPLVAEKPYDDLLYVPCPVDAAGIEVEGLAADDPRARSDRTLFIDTRSEAEFAAWHVAGALHMPHDPLQTPTDETIEAVARQVAASGRRQVLVYCAGDWPDAEDFGRLLAKNGIRNVFHVRGGAPALRAEHAR